MAPDPESGGHENGGESQKVRLGAKMGRALGFTYLYTQRIGSSHADSIYLRKPPKKGKNCATTVILSLYVNLTYTGTAT